VRALDVLFILHADHEQNCSHDAMRVVGVAPGRPVLGARGARAALYGPAARRRQRGVVRMLDEIGSIDNVPASSSA
jgi:citrate synthase